MHVIPYTIIRTLLDSEILFRFGNVLFSPSILTSFLNLRFSRAHLSAVQRFSMTSLEGKVIAITGAASGIGLATARLCAARGASISIADIRQEPLDVAVADIQQSNSAVKIYAKTVDVKNSQEVHDWLDETVRRLGPLTSAANLAGVFKAGKQIADTQDEDWDFVMDVNVKGVFNCIRAQLQRMDKDASIVNASSIAGLHGYGGGAAYSTSKVGSWRSLSLSRLAVPSCQSAKNENWGNDTGNIC